MLNEFIDNLQNLLRGRRINMVKVSVIIPVYNAKQYLHRCLKSIQDQTYKNIEILVVDDGSNDGSSEICDLYKRDHRFQVFHQSNMGQSVARNFALDHATGDYILFVDADDYINPDLIKNCIKYIDNDIDAIFFNHIEIEEDGDKQFVHEFQKEGISINWGDIKQIYHLILMDKISNLVWNKLYKKDIWDSIRFPVGMCYEDLFIHPKLFTKIKKVKYVSEYLYVHNGINPNSTTSSINDYNPWNRYCKFCAYREHEQVAEQIGDTEAAYWARSQAVHESIKSLYINYKSCRQLTVPEIEDMKYYLKQVDSEHKIYNLNMKFKILKWSALSYPPLYKFYGMIRYYQEKLRKR